MFNGVCYFRFLVLDLDLYILFGFIFTLFSDQIDSLTQNKKNKKFYLARDKELCYPKKLKSNQNGTSVLLIKLRHCGLYNIEI